MTLFRPNLKARQSAKTRLNLHASSQTREASRENIHATLVLWSRRLFAACVAMLIAASSLALVACDSKEASSQQEQQDDCYGDDLPVTNED